MMETKAKKMHNFFFFFLIFDLIKIKLCLNIYILRYISQLTPTIIINLKEGLKALYSGST